MSAQNNTNNDKSGKKEAISEKDIQMKLYGGHKKPQDQNIRAKGEFSEDSIQKKLYGGEKKPEITPAKKNEDLFEQKPVVKEKNISEQEQDIQPGLQEEIDALKQAIENLEEKLNRTESQKQKLKVKLIQKRKMINVTDRLADFIFNKMPEKFIFIISVVVIILLISVIARLRPKQDKTDMVEKTAVIEKAEPVVQPARQETAQLKTRPEPPVSIAADDQTDPGTAGKYTIQVAEYADEQAAISFVGDLKNKGFDVSVITIYRGPNKTRPYFKINVGSFDNFNQAKSFNQTFQEKTDIRDSFIRKTR